MRLPDFVVIGAQKSASTFLADQLGARQDVYVSKLEIPYFEHPFFTHTPLNELGKVGAEVGAGVRYGIKRADYLARPEVPENLFSVIPGAQLIAVLRPPVQRAVSGAYWYMLHGFLPVRPLNDTLLGLLNTWHSGIRDRSTEVLSYGMYGESLARWMGHFPSQSLVAIDSRTLSEESSWHRLEQHLALDPAPRPDGEVVRSNPGVYDPARLRLLRLRAPLVYDWSKDERFQYRDRPFAYRPIRTTIAKVPTLLDRFVVRRFSDSGPEALTPEVEERLTDLYQSDLELLIEVAGVDLRDAAKRST